MKLRSSQAGYTASAMAIMLTVASVTTIGVSSRTLNFAAEAQGAAHGKILSDVNQAIGVYMANNYPALQNGTPIAGVTNPYSPTIPELQAMGGLNAQLSPTPPLGGSYATQIAREPAGCTGSGCNLTSRVWLTAAFLNTDTGNPDIRRLGAAVQEIGGDGGFSDNTSPATIRGIAGWSRPNPVLNQAGILMAINGYGSSAFGQFFRKDGSVAMTGSADFGGQSLNNANVLSANQGTFTGNITANQANLSGRVTVPGGNNVVVGSVALYGDTTNSAIRQSGAFHIQRFDGSSADIAQVGNITTYGQVNAASSHVRGNQVVVGEMQTYANAVIAGSVRPSAFGGYVYEGWGCGEGNGAMRSDPSGVILSCQSNVWRKAGGASSSGTGLTGIYAPLKNKIIGCTAYMTDFQAMVDGNGYPYYRSKYFKSATWPGWTMGVPSSPALTVNTNGIFASVSDGNADNPQTYSCSAAWPYT